ncbi:MULTISPECIES: rod shape-determining protein MreC [unclassified Moraxella]|uniref:rod shape-determining protein MreC n=1 Tax=unclassified Moraxella TaxID=2685852 RepID=UPI003AF9EC12
MSLTIFTQQPLAMRKTAIVAFIAVVFMLLDSKNPTWFQPLRNVSHASMQPIYQMSAYPSFFGHWVDGSTTSKEALRRENIQLKTALAHANAQLQQQDYLIAENSRLQGILSATRIDQFNLVLSQVIGTDSNPLRQMVVINKGAKDGVKIGQTVLDEKGILGQVINVYDDTCRVLLISDDQQSVAVTIKRTGQKAIVTGKGNPQYLSLDYIFKASDVRIGDELISSGLGGRIPAGFPVGRVAKVESEQAGGYAKIMVTPSANFVNTSYVLLLQQKS